MEKYSKEWREWNEILHERFKAKNRLAGLSFFKTTSSRYRWLIVSRHYPWELCWSWLFDVCLRKPTWKYAYWSFRKPLIIWRGENGRKNMDIVLRFFFIEFSFKRQDYGPHIVDRFYYEKEQVN